MNHRLCSRCTQLDTEHVLRLDANLSIYPKDREGTTKQRLDSEQILRPDAKLSPHPGGRECTTKQRIPILRLGYVKDADGHSPCAMCRLLSFVKNRCDIHSSSSVLYSLKISGLREHTYRLAPEALVVTCEDCTDRRLSTYVAPYEKLSSASYYGISYDTGGSCGLANDDYVLPALRSRSQVDFGMLRTWLDICETEHIKDCDGGEQRRRRPLPVNLRLIDCQQQNVVLAHSGKKYAALSYVWGRKADETYGASSDRVASDGSLPTNLPRTIADSLVATLQLGLRFIWIDRYCINQDDEADRARQIRQMDLIYLHASVTIIAAAGKDSHFGLPGVAQSLRPSLPAAVKGSRNLIAVPLRTEAVVENSVWMTRAWTFQEAFFSRRRLVFTEDQVYFECLTAQCPEVRGLPIEFDFGKIFRTDTHYNSEPWGFYAHLAPYTRRALTFQSDAINAFRGILDHYQSREPQVRDYFGIPVMPSLVWSWPFVRPRRGPNYACAPERNASQSFIAGLCWRHDKAGARRSCFPSWTWAGWACSVSYMCPQLPKGLKLCPEDQVQVWIEGNDKTSLAIETMLSKAEESPTAILGTVILLEAMVMSIQDVTLIHSSAADAGGWHVVVKGQELAVALQMSILDSEWAKQLDEQNGRSIEDGEVLGVLLSGDMNQKRKVRDDDFILLVRKKGQIFERVGHMVMDEGHTKVGDNVQNQWVRCLSWSELEPYWNQLLKGRTRTTLRIG